MVSIFGPSGTMLHQNREAARTRLAGYLRTAKHNSAEGSVAKRSVVGLLLLIAVDLSGTAASRSGRGKIKMSPLRRER